MSNPVPIDPVLNFILESKKKLSFSSYFILCFITLNRFQFDKNLFSTIRE